MWGGQNLCPAYSHSSYHGHLWHCSAKRQQTGTLQDAKAQEMVAVCKDLCAFALKFAGRKSTAAGATPKTATGTGALPSQVPVGGRAPAPANGSLGWTNGAKGPGGVLI